MMIIVNDFMIDEDQRKSGDDELSWDEEVFWYPVADQCKW